MNKVQRAVLVLGAAGMVASGVNVLYRNSVAPKLEWGLIGDAPFSAFAVDPRPTVILVASVAAATAALCFACQSRKG